MSKSRPKKRQKGPIKRHVASKETASDSALEKKAKPLYLSTLLAWDLHFIAQYIRERERTTIEILRQRKLTKKEVLADLKEVLDTAKTAKEIALEIAAKAPQQFGKLAEESLIVLGETTAPVVWYYGKISLRKSEYDQDWLYKCSLRAYRQANEHRQKLQELSDKIEAKDEMWELYIAQKRDIQIRLKGFFEKYCERRSDFESYRKRLYRIRKKYGEEIGFPKPIGDPKRGDAHIFILQELLEVWPKAREKDDQLPPLNWDKLGQIQDN